MAVAFEAFSLVLALLAGLFLNSCNAFGQAGYWPKDDAKNALREGGNESYDFVIVGATTAGALVANLLSENPKWQILVLETGVNQTYDAQLSDLITLMENSKFTYRHDMKLNPQSCKAIENAKCYWPRSKGRLYVRSNRFNYNTWQWELVNTNPVCNKTQLHKEYKPEIVDEPNVKMIRAVQVNKLKFDNTSRLMKSVEFTVSGLTLTVQVKKEVIISAGIVETPKLLMLSGVGTPDALNPLSIPVKHNLYVGHFLQEHFAVQMFVKFKDEPDELKNLLNIVPRLIWEQQRVIYTSHYERATYANTEVNHEIIRKEDFESLELLLNNLNVKEDFRAYFKEAVKSCNLLVVFISFACKNSVAGMKLASTSPYQAPELYFNYTTTSENKEIKLRLVNYLLKLDVAMALQAQHPDFLHIPLEACDQHQFRSVRYWLCYINYFSASVYHQVGTVKMGGHNDATTCVNSRLQLKGVKNVRVADASIMPYAITGDDKHDIEIAIAQKAADFIRNYYGAVNYLYKSKTSKPKNKQEKQKWLLVQTLTG